MFVFSWSFGFKPPGWGAGNEHPKKVMELLIEFARLMGSPIDFPMSSRLFDKLKLVQASFRGAQSLICIVSWSVIRN
jgi:hypothetical protein